MHSVYVACLFGGAVATVLFAILGWAGGAAHGGHAHSPLGHTYAGAHAQGGHTHVQTGAHTVHQHPTAGSKVTSGMSWVLAWLSPLTLAAAAAFFGGIGLIAEGNVLALLFAIVAAIVGAILVRSAMNAFVRASTPPLSLGAEGAIATVNATIRPGSPGEVLYTLEGLHRSLPARSIDGSVIPRGTTVVITRREGGFAWVEPLDPLEELTEDSSTTHDPQLTTHD